MRPPLASRLTRFARRFARDEGGAITVEALLWIPFFFFVLALITDASLAFFAKAEAFRIVQNGNRFLSVGNPCCADEGKAQNWIEGAFARSANDEAITTISDDDTIVSTELSFPIRDVVLFNIFGVPNDWEITVRSQHYVEWPNP